MPLIPAEFGHEALVSDFGMLGNDIAGDCVLAGACHETMLWTSEGSTMAQFDARNALDAYSELTGYDQATGSGDNGTPVRDAMEYRYNTGLKDATGKRHKIGAYATIEAGDIERIRSATYLFSAVGMGILFPESAMDQFNAGEAWDVVSDEQPKEGHYIPIVASRSTKLFCVTWGKVQAMTYAFARKYCDEAWMIFSHEFVRNGVSPDGFDLSALLDDVKSVTA